MENNLDKVEEKNKRMPFSIISLVCGLILFLHFPLGIFIIFPLNIFGISTITLYSSITAIGILSTFLAYLFGEESELRGMGCCMNFFAVGVILLAFLIYSVASI